MTSPVTRILVSARRRTRTALLVFQATFLLMRVAASAQTPTVSLDQFTASDESGRVQILRLLAASRVSLPPDQVAAVIRAGLEDAQDNIRARAMWALAGRALPTTKGPDDVSRWRQERPLLQELRPQLPKFLSDRNEDVRLATIAAISNLETDPAIQDKSKNTLDLTLARALTSRFAAEPSPLVRSRILTVFAWFSTEPGRLNEVNTVLESALKDVNAGVVQAGLFAVGNRQIISLLPQVVGHLKDSTPAMRATAAQSLGRFGTGARDYTPELQSALAAESDLIARQALQAAIVAIGR